MQKKLLYFVHSIKASQDNSSLIFAKMSSNKVLRDDDEEIIEILDEDDQDDVATVAIPLKEPKVKKFRFSPRQKKRKTDFTCTIEAPTQCLGDKKTCPTEPVFDLPYCKKHLQEMLHLKIGTSNFLVKAKGVFAHMTAKEKKQIKDGVVFKPDQQIVQYTGTKLNRDELALRYATKEHLAPFVIEIDKDSYLDAACECTVGALIAVTDLKKEANVDIVRVEGGNTVYVRAIKEIKAGEELVRYSRIAYNAKYIEVHYSISKK